MSTSNNKPLSSLFIIASCIAAISIGSFIGRQIEANFTILFQWFQQLLEPRTFPVDFNVAGNKYAWSLIVTSVEALTTPQIVNFTGGTTLTCNRKVNWYYFNTARGLRTWPIDTVSLTNLQAIDGSYSTLSMLWGLYTACIGHPQDIVWYISYSDNAVPQWAILFGVTMINATNSYTSTYASGSFIIEDYKKPIWHMYDTLIGIGYVDGSVSTSCVWCGGGGGLADTFWHLAVQWRLWISKVVDNTERTALKGNIGKKSLVYSTDEVTASTIINLTTKNAEIYCRWGTIYTNIINAIGSDKSKAICIDASATSPLVIDNSNISRIQNKDIIVRKWNVFIDKDIYQSNKTISIFVDKWNLIFDSDIQPTDLTSFDKNGFVSATNPVTKWIFLQGNYVVNGLVLASDSPTGMLRPIEAKTFVQGKFASLNLPTVSNPQREKQITNTVWWLLANNATWYINLESLFTRRCNPNTWYGSTGIINTTIGWVIACNGSWDIHYDRSFVVIEKEFPSILFKR